MNDKAKNAQMGFKLMKYSVVISVVLTFIVDLTISEDSRFAAGLGSLPVLVQTILLIVASYNLREFNSNFNKFHNLVLITTLPNMIAMATGWSVNATILSTKMETMSTALLIGVLAFAIAIIVLTIKMYKEFVLGVKDLVSKTEDSNFEFLNVLSDQFYKRTLILQAYLPIGMFAGILVFGMLIPEMLITFVMIITMITLAYSLFHLIKTFNYYGICEKLAPKLIK